MVNIWLTQPQAVKLCLPVQQKSGSIDMFSLDPFRLSAQTTAETLNQYWPGSCSFVGPETDGEKKNS